MSFDRLKLMLGRSVAAGDPEVSESGSPWLVVGLGNPGPGYAGHRHNIGYRVTDELARRWGLPWRAHKSGRAHVVEGRLGVPGQPGPRLVLGRAQGYMNTSGGPVKSLAEFYKIPVEQIVVIHDELDLPFETMRAKLGGGDNGHNGLKSIRSSLGTGDYLRVRAGIGRPTGRQEVHDFVLSDFSSAERKQLDLFVVLLADCVESLITQGLAETQQRFNS